MPAGHQMPWSSLRVQRRKETRRRTRSLAVRSPRSFRAARTAVSHQRTLAPTHFRACRERRPFPASPTPARCSAHGRDSPRAQGPARERPVISPRRAPRRATRYGVTWNLLGGQPSRWSADAAGRGGSRGRDVATWSKGWNNRKHLQWRSYGGLPVPPEPCWDGPSALFSAQPSNRYS